MKINEIFYSIQGEGIQIGIPTVFIRTAGCNLRCKWCDTTYAYVEGEEIECEKLLNHISIFPTKHVCITGGEPLIQEDVINLIDMLISEGYQILFETNGSKTIEGLPKSDSLIISLDIKCPSSEMVDKMYLNNLEMLEPKDQVKFVIGDEKDYEYAKELMKRYHPKCNIIMMPVFGSNIKLLAERILRDNLGVRVLPQLHKLIWGEIRGV
jgi:7-carboxy-7-deazaguanine synthase